MTHSNTAELHSWLKERLGERPEMEPRDAYKLLYQGLLGSEHLITSPESFARWLAEELDSVEARGSEPLWEAIRPDGALGRVNLRPFKAQAGDPAALLAACLETARRKWGTLDELAAAWEEVVEANRRHAWPGWDFEALMEITRLVQAKGYPPLHHSQAYSQIHQPAYRLVAADLLPGLSPA
jgi:hypothetical protein